MNVSADQLWRFMANFLVSSTGMFLAMSRERLAREGGEIASLPVCYSERSNAFELPLLFCRQLGGFRQAAYVILTLIIVITAIWSIRLSRKQSQAALEESRSQSQEALKIMNEQIAKNEQQANVSLEAVYEQIDSSKQQARDTFYNQIRPIIVCTGQPQVTLINMENVGFGVATDVWGMYRVKPTDESPPFSSSFAGSMIFLPHEEQAITLLEDDFVYGGSEKLLDILSIREKITAFPINLDS
jgi:hypothetical protein